MTGLRVTRQRVAIESLLGDVEDFRSAQQLHELLRERGETVGLATVYRNLQSLVEAGKVDALRLDADEVVYRRCRTAGHHHHLVCRSCGATVELDGAAVESWTREVARRHGYRDVDHVIEIFGVCDRCADEDPPQEAGSASASGPGGDRARDTAGGSGGSEPADGPRRDLTGDGPRGILEGDGPREVLAASGSDT